MRVLALFLALMATAKVVTVEWLHRSASDDIIMATFSTRALEACNRDAHRKVLGLEAAVWSTDAQMHVAVGDKESTVALWRIDNPAWARRYRRPTLQILAGQGTSQVTCTYDLISGVAAVRRS